MKTDELRQRFLDFFKSRRHRIVESDSLVPKDDPTVLFTPAGMNQFKKQFLGEISGFTRAATSQRCLRTDDLDKVGKTALHHTFFEMLGNFSFGDYFKKEAIAWAWEFLTGELKIDADKLWVSVYRDDDEAYGIWRDAIKVPQEKIARLGDKENFWPAEAKEKGPNGPCGPCSEIFYDFGPQSGCQRPDCSPSCDCGRFSEVWNLVFTQFNRRDGAVLEPLPQKNIDTGMGLERLAAVMQGVSSNFETDLFQPIIKEISSGLAPEAVGQQGLIYAIADHLRAIVFAIYDGVLPSNEGRGYVVRKIIRKCILHAFFLKNEKPFLYRLVPVVAEIMRTAYPELIRAQEDIAQVVQAEEKRFVSILKNSDRYLAQTFQGTTNLSGADKIAGLVFKLTDTYGLPLEIIMPWLQKGLLKEESEKKETLKFYEQRLQGQRARSQRMSMMKGSVFTGEELMLALPATKFLGYQAINLKAKVLKILKGGHEVKKVVQGEEAAIVLNQTVFYAEAGGQVADTGRLVKGKNIFTVEDTRRLGKVVVHTGVVSSGSFKKSDFISAEVDAKRRLSIERNHTATHLLQTTLRKILGGHVKQQGSLVCEERLRFDFTHFQGLSEDELSRVEEEVNRCIWQDFPLSGREMTREAARKTKALAFFAEKYAERVRVVSIGDFSKELCGGTHLSSTAAIGIFKIVREGSVSSGVRRIEAVTAEYAYRLMKEEELQLREAAALLDVTPDKAREELDKKLRQLKQLQRQLAGHNYVGFKEKADELLKGKLLVNKLNFICHRQDSLGDIAMLSRLVDEVKEQAVSNSVIALGAEDASSGRSLLVIAVTSDLAKEGISASDLFKQLEKVTTFRGGGRPEFAQGGSRASEDLEKAFAALKEIISSR